MRWANAPPPRSRLSVVQVLALFVLLCGVLLILARAPAGSRQRVNRDEVVRQHRERAAMQDLEDLGEALRDRDYDRAQMQLERLTQLLPRLVPDAGSEVGVDGQSGSSSGRP